MRPGAWAYDPAMRLVLACAVVLAAALTVAPAGAQERLCALYTPAPLPREGVPGPVFVAQVPGACDGEETHYRATVDWGDGTPPGTDIRPEPLGGGVGGRHVFRRAGTYVATATVTDLRSGAQQRFHRTLPIANQPLRRGPRLVVGVRRLRVARFRDGNPLAEAGDFAVRVRAGGRTHRARVVADTPTGFAVVLDRALPARVTRAVARIADGRGATLTVTSPVRVR